jgi:hypothetical protein
VRIFNKHKPVKRPTLNLLSEKQQAALTDWEHRFGASPYKPAPVKVLAKDGQRLLAPEILQITHATIKNEQQMAENIEGARRALKSLGPGGSHQVRRLMAWQGEVNGQ